MATIAEIQEVLDRIARYNEEATRRDAEYKVAEERRNEEAARRDAERKAERDADWKKTEAALRKLSNQFNDQWSRLVEALVNNQVVPLLNARGIPVTSTLEREKGRVGDRNFEFDIIAKNGYAIVVIEVKTTLRPDDVKEFLDELSHIKEWLPMYAHLTVHGAVAYLHAVAEADNFAQKKGLLTILATGKGAKITNPDSFKPKEW